VPGPLVARGVATARFRWYTLAQAVSIVGTTMSLTALYWLALRLAHGRAAVLALLVAAQFLPMLLFSRRAGVIAGRHPAARVVIVTQAALAAGSLAIGLPLLAGWLPVWYLWALSLAVGCAQTLDVTGRQLFMNELVGPAELRRGTSRYAAVTGLAKIAGPGIAGLLIAASGEAVVFLADAASFLLVIAVLAVLARGVAGVGPAREARPATPGRRLRWVLDLPRGIQLAAGMALLIGGFGIQFEVTNPLMATRVLHLGPVGFGLLGTCLAVGGIAANLITSRRRDPGRAEFLGWAVLFGAAETAAALMPAVWAYDAMLAVVGAAIQLFAVSATVYVQQHAAPAQRGPALSAYNGAFMGFVPAGSFAVAGVAAVAGVRWALAGPGIVIAAVAGLALLAGARAVKPAPGRAAVNAAPRAPLPTDGGNP